ncbi:hypothetical protein Pla144_40800 [Bythopirellula polymerisocia]|uniref:PilZ domain-containing protein n=1 Tax=Bythopirellula polymerisocia TaxID=2528003 RepID=A0A5C6CDG6_9BACT|nr:hypothetical protein Pla144_40800 [Bythopirellula polymerisocia]
MLGISNETDLNEQVWQSLTSRTVLLCSFEEYLQSERDQPFIIESKRLYARRSLHKIAIAMLGGNRHACFAKDISRMGVGFYAPINILPKKKVTLWFAGGKVLQLSITRCRRLGDKCFECGGTFQLPAKISRPHLCRSA